ncbi:response regulator [candidate division KSB1 bacterium]
MSEKSILVIDDETEITEIFKEILAGVGYDVTTACSGEEALEILSKRQFKVILSDLKMPGMTGDELCWNIRKKDKSTVIIAVTGYHKDFSKEHFLEIGFNDYLFKPVLLSDLVKTVKKAFDSD